jgi:hypothetical protein
VVKFAQTREFVLVGQEHPDTGLMQPRGRVPNGRYIPR